MTEDIKRSALTLGCLRGHRELSPSFRMTQIGPRCQQTLTRIIGGRSWLPGPVSWSFSLADKRDLLVAVYPPFVRSEPVCPWKHIFVHSRWSEFLNILEHDVAQSLNHSFSNLSAQTNKNLSLNFAWKQIVLNGTLDFSGITAGSISNPWCKVVSETWLKLCWKSCSKYLFIKFQTDIV